MISLDRITMKTFVLLFVLISAVTYSNSQDFWTKIPGIDLSVRNITLNYEGDMLVTVNNAILKSYDGGETWVKKASLGTYSFPLDIVMNHDGHIYISLHSNILIKSINHGETWFNLYSLPYPDPQDLMYYPSGKLFATPFVNGLYVSEDEGTTFTKVESIETPNVWQMDIDSKGTIYAGSDEHIFISYDEGETWKVSEISAECATAYSIKVLPNDYIVVGSKGSRCGMFISKDAGETWEQINEGFDLWNYIQVEDIFFVDSYKIFAATNAYGVFRTLDGGLSWDHLPTIEGVDLYWRVFVDKNGSLFVGANNGLYRSNSNVLGIEHHRYPNIAIVPNPVNNYFIIDGLDPDQISMIKIIDSNAEEVIVSTTYSETMASNLPTGVYFMMIYIGEDIKLLPFVKN